MERSRSQNFLKWQTHVSSNSDVKPACEKDKNMKTYKFNSGVLAFMAAILLFTASTASAKVTPDQAQQIAETAYLYGLQQNIYFGQRYTYTQNDSKDNKSYAGVNRFFDVRKK
jgi:hypothetical protein